MREEEKLHFSPKYIFADIARALKANDKKLLLEAFRDRVYGFYFEPARILDKKKLGFSCGLLCAATIDSLARLIYPKLSTGDRIKKWLTENIKEFAKEDFATRFYEDFRCGLVHEGRIKNPGEFSYNCKEVVSKEDTIIRINPRLLLRKLEEVLKIHIVNLQKNPEAYDKFRNLLEQDFGEESSRELKN